MGADISGLMLAKDDGTAIMVLTNYDNGGKCRLEVDFKALGLAPGATTRNFETGEEVSLKNGVYALDFVKHGYKVITLAAPRTY